MNRFDIFLSFFSLQMPDHVGGGGQAAVCYSGRVFPQRGCVCRAAYSDLRAAAQPATSAGSRAAGGRLQ